MKSLKKYFSVILIAVICLITYAAEPKSDYVALSTKYTPENSVVIIFVDFASFDLFQINPNYPAHSFSVKENVGCTEPMVPGSCYMRSYLQGFNGTNWVGSPTIPNSLPFPYLNEKQDNTLNEGPRISIPKKPGLYVYYIQRDIEVWKHSGIVIGKITNDIEEWKTIPVYRKRVLKHFVNSAKVYAGTPWEPLINEYVKEWSNEK